MSILKEGSPAGIYGEPFVFFGNLTSLAILSKTAAHHTSCDFVAFLEEVVSLCPPRQQIHIILDNLADHETLLVRNFFQPASARAVSLHPYLFLMAQPS
jgi:hypothetical protein